MLDSPEVNAFALPGGYVYVTRGIMAYMESEADLAGVIGHEIGHVTARHGAQRATRQQNAGLGVLAAQGQVILAVGAAALAMAWGTAAPLIAPQGDAPGARMDVALLQGNIPQDQKFIPGTGVADSLRFRTPGRLPMSPRV